MIEWPDHQRPWEWELFRPLVGTSMLELGNKRKGDIVYKEFFQSIGYRHVSVDLNGMDGALRLDLSEPLDLGTFDMVSNLGTSEHVSESNYRGQVQCWRNILEAMHVGSVLINITPQPGTWRDHGTWYPHESFFGALAECNGLEVQRVFNREWIAGNPNRRLVMARLIRLEDRAFQMPAKEHMFQNR